MGNEKNNLKQVSKSVIKRLALYSRTLHRMELDGATRISSRTLADILGLNPAQVRKDLAHFGQFGVPGFGYRPCKLRDEIRKILGTNRVIRVGIVGVGNLGRALLSYGGFQAQGFRFVAAFDSDQRKIGRSFNKIRILSTDQLEKNIRDKKVDLVILAVPAKVAQEVTDRLVQCGITAILNFVPLRLIVPPEVKIHYVDLAMELESLSFYLK